MSLFVPEHAVRVLALKSLIRLFGTVKVPVKETYTFEKACAINCRDLEDYKKRITSGALSLCLKHVSSKKEQKDTIEPLLWSEEAFSDLLRVEALLTLNNKRQREKEESEKTNTKKRQKLLF